MNVGFFFNDTATTEIYTLSLHDALPILAGDAALLDGEAGAVTGGVDVLDALHARVAVDREEPLRDRKSTRLNSSHANISYAVFCLKKKKYSSFSFHISYYVYFLSTQKHS